MVWGASPLHSYRDKAHEGPLTNANPSMPTARVKRRIGPPRVWGHLMQIRGSAQEMRSPQAHRSGDPFRQRGQHGERVLVDGAAMLAAAGENGVGGGKVLGVRLGNHPKRPCFWRCWGFG